MKKLGIGCAIGLVLVGAGSGSEAQISQNVHSFKRTNIGV